jgi:poly(A) polymerase
MLDRFIHRVKDIFAPRSVIVKTPRVIPASEHGIDPALVSDEAKKTCEALQRRGFKAYVVGGAVRDLLRGVPPKDFDVATDATPEQVKRCQRRAVIIGRRFQLVHVIFGREVIECSTFRALEGAGQRKDATGRVISDNVFGEMWEDAARRDFTVNALYYDPQTQEILDYHHGFEDLAAKRLRIIGDPAVRYREDPVRMMRAVRIAAKLGFTIEPAAERLIPKMAPLLSNVPSARLVDELLKLLTCGHAVDCMKKLRADGLHKALLPLLDVIVAEPEGEQFLMLALKRTDERIAIGKKISPSFLFGTLLWPQVKKRWDYNEQTKGMSRLQALHAASVEVLATQCQQLNIQRRYQADMHDLWMLQARFERRTGKNPYALVTHPRYRAAYDFMMLRSQLGHVPQEWVTWWKAFYEGDEDRRAGMIEQAQQEARRTGDQARRGRRAAAAAAAEGAAPESADGTAPRRRRRRRPRTRRLEGESPRA